MPASKRECIRVNITIETDEDDLLNNYRLQDGPNCLAKWSCNRGNGRGTILLLDEIDLASNKIMCLQPILEVTACLLKRLISSLNLLTVSM